MAQSFPNSQHCELYEVFHLYYFFYNVLYYCSAFDFILFPNDSPCSHTLS